MIGKRIQNDNALARNNSELFDKLRFPNVLRDIDKGIFVSGSSTKSLHFKSKLSPSIIYKIRMDWPEIGRYQREVNSLRKKIQNCYTQIFSLQVKEKNLREDIDSLQGSILKPYNISCINIDDPEIEPQFESFVMDNYLEDENGNKGDTTADRRINSQMFKRRKQ